MPHSSPEAKDELLETSATETSFQLSEPDELQIAIREHLNGILTPQQALADGHLFELLEKDPTENPYLCKEVLRRIQGTGILTSANTGKKPLVTPTGQSCQIAQALRVVPPEYIGRIAELRTSFYTDGKGRTPGVIAAHTPYNLDNGALRTITKGKRPFSNYKRADQPGLILNGIDSLGNGLCNPFVLPESVHVTHVTCTSEGNFTTNVGSRRLGMFIPAGHLYPAIRQAYENLPNHYIVRADITKHT